jgi:hypothetical protein
MGNIQTGPVAINHELIHFQNTDSCLTAKYLPLMPCIAVQRADIDIEIERV